MENSRTTDPHLRSIVEAAEKGVELQRIVVMCGATTYVGIPVSTGGFIKATHNAYVDEVVKGVGGWKTSWQEKEAIATERVNDMFASIALQDSGSTPEVLSLLKAAVIPPGMTSYEVPALRIHLGQIDSWWTAPFVDHQAKIRGGGVGVSF